MFVSFPGFAYNSPACSYNLFHQKPPPSVWLRHLTWIHDGQQPAKVARHFLEDESFSAVGPWRLADHPSEEHHLVVHGEHRAARAHGAVGIGLRKGAAHFVGNQVGVITQTVRQWVVYQMVEGERALEGRCLLGFFPAGDDGGEHLANENTLCEVSFRQTCRKHIFLKSDGVMEFDDSQIIIRATGQVVRVDDNVFHVQSLPSLLRAGAALAWGSRTRRWGSWCVSTTCTHKGTSQGAVICLGFWNV